MDTLVKVLGVAAALGALLFVQVAKQQTRDAARRTPVERAPDGTRVETRAMRESALALIAVALGIAVLGAVVFASEGEAGGLGIAAAGVAVAAALAATLAHRRRHWHRPGDS